MSFSALSNIALASASEKKWDARYAGPIPHNAEYYFKCLIAGALACGVTHTVITPLDVAKCNMQVNPAFQGKGLPSVMKGIVAEEGARGLWKGWAPTAIGYSAQGMLKFGLYEYFKDVYSNLLGEENAKKYNSLVYIAGSASAEFFADIALCPMEMVKVKVQTAPKGTVPTALGPALGYMRANAAETGFPFKSLSPLWSRQIPYTVAKFLVYEKVVEAIYGALGKTRADFNDAINLSLTFLSGYISGVVCAIVSHPADSIVSQLGKAENKGKAIGQIVKEVGLKNICTSGLLTRIIMIGTLTGLQWYIFDGVKTALGLQPKKK